MSTITPLARIERVYLPTETLGTWYHMPERKPLVKTMELPWRNNQRSTTGFPSCIPEGIHRVIKQPAKASRPYPYFRLPDVKGRTGILVHRITMVKDLLGCIGVGMEFKDFNKDGVPDMARSTEALEYLLSLYPEEFYLEILKKAA